MSATSAVRRNLPVVKDISGSIFRAYIGGNAIVTWYVAMTDPRSLMHLLAMTGEGAVLIWLLMFIGIVLLLDVVINDFLPHRFHWRPALRQRHFILFAMAFCYVAQLYVAVARLYTAGLLLYYLWNAVAIMFIAFIDANQRSKDATCVIVCN